MKIRVPYYYKDFKCIASKCTDTCCAGWEIIIDDDTYKKYKDVKSDFGKRLNSEITKYEDNEPGFKLKNNNCAFLNNNLLCDIYSNLGEEYLCHTCKTFPRIINEYGSLREITLSLSCPEAARLILKDNQNLSFDLSENDEFVTTYNTISPDLYIQILGARQIVFDVLKSSSFNFYTKVSIILKFADDIQKKIDACTLSEISLIRKQYSDNDFLNSLASSFNKGNIEAKYEIIHNFINIFNDMEEINKEWTKTVHHSIDTLFIKNNCNFYCESKQKFNEYYSDKLYEFENIFSYFIFRYFMQSLNDADILSKVKLSVLSMLIIKTLDIVKFVDNDYKFNLDDAIEISHMYSKDIEHCDENIEKLYDIFNEDDNFSTENFLKVLN